MEQKNIYINSAYITAVYLDFVLSGNQLQPFFLCVCAFCFFKHNHTAYIGLSSGEGLLYVSILWKL